jgi:hypothetical protein
MVAMDTNILENSIKDLNDWFESPEMAFIALNGGFELTIRDRLLFSIQQRMPDSCIKSEYYHDKKWADIAVIKDGKPTSLIELKANFLIQLSEITGFGISPWKKNDFRLPKKTKNQVGRLEKDRQKWKNLSHDISLYGIHIVANIEKENLSPALAKNCCKYPLIQKKDLDDYKKSVKAYYEYLTKLKTEAFREIPPVQTSCESPHAVTASLFFYILEL